MLWQGQDDNVRIYVLKNQVDKAGPKWATSEEAKEQISPQLVPKMVPKTQEAVDTSVNDFGTVPISQESARKAAELVQKQAKKMVQTLYEESKSRRLPVLNQNVVSQIIVPVVPTPTQIPTPAPDSIPVSVPTSLPILAPAKTPVIIDPVPSPPKKLAVEKSALVRTNSGGFKTTPLPAKIDEIEGQDSVQIVKKSSESSFKQPIKVQNPVQTQSSIQNPIKNSTIIQKSSPEIQRRQTLTQIREKTQNSLKNEELMPSPELKDRAKNLNLKTPGDYIKEATLEAEKNLSKIKIKKVKKVKNDKLESKTKLEKSYHKPSLKSTSEDGKIATPPKPSKPPKAKVPKLRSTNENRINNRYEKAMQNAKKRQNMRLWAVNKEKKFLE